MLILNQSIDLHSSLTDNSHSLKYVTVLFTTTYQAPSWDANSMRIIQGVSNGLGRKSGVSSTQQNKETISIFVRKHLFLQVMSTTFSRIQSFSFSSVGTITNRRLFSFNLKRTDISQMNFWCPSNHSQPLRDLWNGTTVHDQICHAYVKWRIFWASVVNCAFRKKKRTEQSLHWERVM